jgi:hypothetical protein
LSPTETYRLYIRTQDGKEYISDFVKPQITPEIDSVNWRYNSEGVNVYVTTSDENSNVKFYEWSFDETWEVRSSFRTVLEYDGKELIIREKEVVDNMFQCWKYRSNTDLITGSTSSLTSNVVYQKPIKFIRLNDERISERYSILVKQHALTKEAFDYLQIISKNTGMVGTFTDPQPSQLYGNIQCVNSDEPVVGYVTAATTSQYRIFISKEDVYGWNYDMFCRERDIVNHPDTLKKYLSTNIQIPTIPIFGDLDEGILVLRISPNVCVDYWE